MLVLILQVAFTICFPALAKLGAKRFKVLALVGPVVLCYICGILFTNTSYLAGSYGWDFSMKGAEGLAFLGVAFSIPILLFATDLIRWMGLAYKTIFSFLLMIFSVLFVAVLASWIWQGRFEESWGISGVLVGLYTGGTPNLNAIGFSLDLERSTLLLINGLDVILGGVYLLCLFTFLPRLCRRFLPPFEKKQGENSEILSFGNEEKLARREWWFAFGKTMGLAIGVVLLSIGISFLIYEKLSFIVVVLSLSSLALVASFSRTIREIPIHFQVGEYFLLIFCFAIGTMTDVKKLMLSDPMLLGYVAFVMFFAILLHLLLAFLFRIDADTTLITSAAGIFGAPFIIPIANAMGNREIIVSGIVTSLVGYAVGTYLGILLGSLLCFFQTSIFL